MNRTKWFGFRFLRALPLAVATLFAAPAASATTGIMDVWGSVTLTENHTGTIVLNGHNARLNCNGKSILDGNQPAFCGEDQDKSCGIYASGLDNPYVINCTVRNFDIGMYVWGSFYPTVRNSTFRSNAEGMRITDSVGDSGTFLLSNTFRNNSEEGLVIRGTTSLRIHSNKFWDNDTDGVDVEGGSRLVFHQNDHDGNAFNGLELDAVSRVTITNSKFVGNGVGNDRNGVSFDNADLATVTGNTMTGNGRNGFRVTDDSDGGNFTSNTGSGNGSHDALQSANSSNTWSGNSWGTRSPASLQ